MTMSNLGRGFVVAAAVAVLCVTWAPAAQAGGVRFSEGHWRQELTLSNGFHAGKRNRESDRFASLAFEYEAPFRKRATLDFRIYPGLAYFESGESTLYAGGFGIGVRLYQKKELKGWYGEIMGSVLLMSGKLRGNGSSVNLFNEAGLGYQFDRWHVSLKVQHISNAGISRDNDGVNAVGLGFGYNF